MRIMSDMKKIYSFEPWFFIFFGVFHLHRIWGRIFSGVARGEN